MRPTSGATDDMKTVSRSCRRWQAEMLCNPLDE